MNLSGNIRKLSIFELFTSAAITLPASGIFTDLLLLRMHFDYALFGFIRSCMFLLPALVYWGLIDVIRNSGKSEGFCRWSYFARIALPVLLPVTALITPDPSIRLWTCVIVFSLGYSAAMIANNTVLVLTRRAVDKQDFNRWSLIFVVMLAFPAALLTLPCAYFLGNPNLNDEQFFLLFLAFEFATGLLYIPAFLAMRNLDLAAEPKRSKVRKPILERLQPFRDKNLRPLLCLTFLQSLWIGLVISYWGIYLLKAWGWNPGWIALTEALLCFSCLFGGIFFGRIADRQGYRTCFMLMIGFMALSLAAAWIWWGTLPVLIISIIFVYNANNGVVSNAMRGLTQSAAAGLAPQGKSEKYIAVQVIIQSVATFLGCCLAGILFGWVAGKDPVLTRNAETQELFRTYFLLANLLLIPQMIAAMFFRHQKKTHDVQNNQE